MDIPIGKSTLREMLPLFIFIIILLIIIIFCFWVIIKSHKNKMKLKKEQGLSTQVVFQHVSGLPIAENLLCTISSFPDRIEFQSGTTNIKLAREKITDMCIKTDTEIQKQVVSSVGGAIAGGVILGPLGAIIGGRAKNKKVKTTSHYLIITYIKSNDELSYTAFDINNNLISANKLISEFKKLNTTKDVHIEL